MLVPRRASGGVGGRQRRTTGWPSDGSRLSNAGGEGSPALSSSAASVRHGDDRATERRIDGREATAHPYLARQMSDFGFRQTLKVRTLGCARRSLPLPAHVSSPHKRSKLHEEQHKGHEVYTSSGHHCGVIPYSSLWCGGLPLGLMMNNTKEEQPREELFLSWCDELLG